MAGVGVPQGSILGPLLFSLFTGALHDVFREAQIDCHFYADDTQFWVPFDPKCPVSESSARLRICNVMTMVSDWMACHSLKLNPDKSIFLPICRTDRSFSQMKLDATEILPSSEARNLGFIFNSKFDLSSHVSNLRKTSFYQLRKLIDISQFVTKNQLCTLMHAFITSRLDFCNSLFYDIPKYQLRSIQNIQNAAAKVVTKAKKYDSNSEQLKYLHWLPVENRVIFKLAVLGYKCFYDLAPTYMEIVPFKSNVYTRSSLVPSLTLTTKWVPRTKYGQRSYAHSVVKVFNHLPAHVRNSLTLTTFKSNLKTHLFTQCFT